MSISDVPIETEFNLRTASRQESMELSDKKMQIFQSKGPAQLGHSGDKIFHVVLFKTVTSYRVLKTHRPWNAYQLSSQQVTASAVPSLKRI